MENYKKAIICIIDRKNNIEINDFDIVLIKSKYSNITNPIYKIMVNNIVISRNNNFLIKYKCLTCDDIRIITLNLYEKKVNKNSKLCYGCSNFNRDMGKKYIKPKIEFNDMPDDFINLYWTKHLTNDEFINIIDKIISIQNDKYNNDYINKFMIYDPYKHINNQQYFYPMLYDKNNNVYEPIINIKFKCENCDMIFITKNLQSIKNKVKMLCKNCSFSNYTFKIKYYNKIRYQSQLEFRFIRFCMENNINIQNGPVIEYYWNGSKHKYYIDFLLPDYQILIELKDNHIWHKHQINNNRWQCKESSAIQYANDSGLKYFLIFPKDIMKLKKTLSSLIMSDTRGVNKTLFVGP